MSRLLLSLAAGSALTMLVLGASVDGAERGGTESRVKAPAVEPHHPRHWRFTMPKGDVAAGRAVFEKFECYYCHRVNGEAFPAPIDSAPELSQMGPLHPLEYFTESVIHANALVARQWRNRDGTSPMAKDHLERMTLRELIDLSSYLAALKPPAMAKTVSGTGKIVALLRQQGEIVIDHGEIKGFMDAMVMGYKLASPAQFKGLSAGDSVNFTIDTAKRVIVKIGKSN